MLGNNFTERVIIRNAQEEDAPRIASLVAVEFQKYIPFFTPSALGRRECDMRRSIANWIVCELDGKIVGAVRHSIDPLGYTFDTLVVCSHIRRRGIGSLLLSRVEDVARSVRREIVVIALRRSLLGNIAFFRAMGYEMIQEFSPFHDLYMRSLR